MKTTHTPSRAGLLGYVFLICLCCFYTKAISQTPNITVRFANPSYDCTSGAYCLDVEFLSDIVGVQLFGMNIRFFYQDTTMELIGFSDFQGGYTPVSPDPPVVVNGPGQFLNFYGSADFVNGAMQLTNTIAPPILLSNITWTKLFKVCFTIDDPGVINLCAPVVWDLKENPMEGGFLGGDDGVVMTIVDPTLMMQSVPSFEHVVQFNWVYNMTDQTHFGMPVPSTCTSLDCSPTIICAANTTVECSSSTNSSSTGSATATDNCVGDPVITQTDSIILGNCPNNFIIKRKWIAKNICNLSDTCIQFINVVDTTVPFIMCPANQTVQCASLVPNPAPGSVVTSDNCTGIATVAFVGDVFTNQICTNHYTINRTYRATDVCGNSATCTQTITVFDTTPPVITCPGNFTFQCASQIPAAVPGSVMSTDNCGGSSTVTFVSDVMSNSTCANKFILTRTYRATDACGNSATCNQTFTVFDNMPPSIACPANMTVQCSGEVPAPNTSAPTASDNCGGVTAVGWEGDLIVNQTCINRYTILRTYRASDLCGNSATCFQIIKVNDQTPPFINCPQNLTFSCASQVPLPNTGAPTATDNCGGVVAIGFIGDVTVNQTCSNRFTVLRTYQASDLCGNTAQCTQTITINDQIPPAITCPQDMTVSCTSQVPAVSFGALSATDNCVGGVQFSFVNAFIVNQTCANRYTLLRVYRATDFCGNSATCTHTIRVFNQTPPAMTCPQNVTVMCANMVPPVNTTSVTSTDNCGGNASITFENEVLSNQTCANRFTITRTYRATDVCGNTATCSQTILVNDQTPPSIICPMNVTFQCAGDVPAPSTTTVTSSDNCGAIASVLFDPDVITNQTCANRFTITRTYRVIDICGNSASCSQTITVNDQIPPTINCPQNLTFTCANEVPPFNTGAPTASDNCGGLVTIGFIGDRIVNQTCANRYTLLRTYQAADVCGNTATCIQTITVNDQLPPTIICPADQSVSCASQLPAVNTGAPTASDNCGGTVAVGFIGDRIINQTCANRYTLLRTYQASDLCGNTATCVQTFFVNDQLPPSISCPQNLTLTCASEVQPPAPATVTASDNCGGVATVTFVNDAVTNQLCQNKYTLTRTYRATDLCGNSATCSQTIIVNDQVPPFIQCPQNMTVMCAGMVPPASLASVVSSDNCGGLSTVTFDGDQISNLTCANRYTVTRTYRATDLCGNTATCTQLITVNDQTPPTITCPPDIILDIESDTLIAGVATATDNCGILFTPTFSDVTFEGVCQDAYIIKRTWFVSDACNNTATCIQTIDVSGGCIVDLNLVKNLDPGPSVFKGGDNVNFTITVTNQGEVTITSLTITDYIPTGFVLNDPDWTAGTAGSTGQSASIVLTDGAGVLGPDGLITGESVSVGITLKASPGITSGVYINLAEISLVYDDHGNDVSAADIDSDADDNDVNDPPGEDDRDPALICVVDPVIVGPLFVCPGDTIVYGLENYISDNTYIFDLDLGGGSIFASTDSTVTVVWQVLPGGPFIVTVNEIVGVGCSAIDTLEVIIRGADPVACIDHINLSIDNECGTIVTSGMILVGEQAGDNNYTVIIKDQLGNIIPNATFTWEHVGQTFYVMVVSECSGNSCWGTVTVEDKLAPVINCVCPAEGVQISDFTGTLNSSSPVFTRPETMAQGGTCISSIAAVPYKAFPFYLSMTGNNQFDVVTFTAPGADSFIALYKDSFDPSSPCTNLVAADDDSGPVFLSQIVATLEADRTYIMVMTTFFNYFGNYYGDFTININSDGEVFLFDPVCQITCREVDQILDGNIPEYLHPEVIDNCGGDTLELINTNLDFDYCANGTVQLTWKATDASGNMSTCLEVLNIVPLTLQTLTFPKEYIGVCHGSSDPSVTGFPQVDGIDLDLPGGLCNLSVTYKDVIIQLCGEGIKIIRTWTVRDWCTGDMDFRSQNIWLADYIGPVLTCSPNITVSTNLWNCYADVVVPRPHAVDACSAITGYQFFSLDGTVINAGNNVIVNGLVQGTHSVKWIVTDECGNTSQCIFNITVVDEVPPVVSCQGHSIVSLTSERPNGITLVPASVFNDQSFDNCGPVSFRARRMDSCIDFDWTTGGACVDEIPGGLPSINGNDLGTERHTCVPFACCDVGSGPIMVELEVTDVAGNVNYCMVEVLVQDKLAPKIDCPPDITISCEFLADVHEGTFRDIDGNNNGSLDEDPLSGLFGNMYDAFNHIQADRKDIIINDPDNTDYHQPHNWGIDGWASDNCEVQLEVTVTVIDDCTGASFPLNRPDYARKLIKRNFRAYDGVIATTCQQLIWVVDYNPFFIADTSCLNENPDDGVIWPCDVLLTTCPSDLTGTGEPVLYDDNCSVVGVSHEDARFDFADSACYKVLRTWKVIDWCQYNQITGAGVWTYTQAIKVMDGISPDFVNCPSDTVELCTDNPGIRVPANNQIFLGENNPNSTSCSVHVTMSQRIHEDCSEMIFYDVKVYPLNGPSFIQMVPTTASTLNANHEVDISFNTEQSTIQAIQQNGLPYNSPLCTDYHRVVWSVTDGCGNESSCDYLFRLVDCKDPTPVLITGISTVLMGPGGSVVVSASNFNASSVDDCTPGNQLLFSFSGTTYQPTFTYTCANVVAFGQPMIVSIWVADGGSDQNCNGQISWSERNKALTTTTIIITDPNHFCGQLQTSLSGEILTDHNDAVEKVIVNLTSPELLFPTYTTTSDGKFVFSNLPIGLDYTITPARNDDYKNGVSTLDLVGIQKHLLGKEIFTSPYQYIAADANGSRNISALDLLDLRKLILGITPELPNSDSWKFLDKNTVFPDPANPWLFNENLFIQQWHGQNTQNDFMAVKIGDVNNSVKANALQLQPREGRRILDIVAETKDVAKTGEVIEVKMIIPELISGFQWTFETDGLEYVNVSSGDIQIDDSNVGLLGNGITTISWNGDVLSYGNNKNEVNIIIRWRATVGGKIKNRLRVTSLVTPAESYSPSGEIMDVKLSYAHTEATTDFNLYQNKPNPWNGQTTIGFDLPEDGPARLTIFDVTGQTIASFEKDYKAGYNTVVLTEKEVFVSGVLYYRLESGGNAASKKMVMIR